MHLPALRDRFRSTPCALRGISSLTLAVLVTACARDTSTRQDTGLGAIGPFRRKSLRCRRNACLSPVAGRRAGARPKEIEVRARVTGILLKRLYQRANWCAPVRRYSRSTWRRLKSRPGAGQAQPGRNAARNEQANREPVRLAAGGAEGRSARRNTMIVPPPLSFPMPRNADAT